jgi:hypothetical protein
MDRWQGVEPCHLSFVFIGIDMEYIEDTFYKITEGKKHYILSNDDKDFIMIMNEDAKAIVINKERIYQLIDFLFNKVLKETEDEHILNCSGTISETK